MNSKFLLGAVAFVAVAAFSAGTFAPLPARAAGATTTTTTTKTVKSVSVPGATTVVPSAGADATVTTNDAADVSDIPADEDSTKSDDSAGTGVTVDDAVTAGQSADTKTTVTTTTDTVTTPAPGEPKPVVAPSIKGHKKGDHKDAAAHAATGSDESTTAGDKAAKAITPLKDPAVPGDGKVDFQGDAAVVH